MDKITITGLSRQRAGEMADALNTALQCLRAKLSDRDWVLLCDLKNALRDIERTPEPPKE